MIMENALKMAVVGPAKVMILSGQLPSEMLMRAPLCRQREKLGIKSLNLQGIWRHSGNHYGLLFIMCYILLDFPITRVKK